LETLLSKLKTKYSFDQADYKTLSGSPNLEICLTLSDAHITSLIERAGRLDAIVESCANLVTIFDSSVPKEELLKTSIRCVGSNELHIFTYQSMIELLVEALLN
ncbi:MAG: hypothetical protein LUH04_17020, partial [Clostridium sp.]|nr:hypothetical protein [Clostridium sp.]